MGVNSANFVILPRLTALVLFIPVIVVFSITAAVLGAYAICWLTHIMPTDNLQVGLQYEFVEWYVWSGFIKALVFAFIISSVSAYFGYTVQGGSVEVGRASTNAVVYSSIYILFADILLTGLLMG